MFFPPDQWSTLDALVEVYSQHYVRGLEGVLKNKIIFNCIESCLVGCVTVLEWNEKDVIILRISYISTVRSAQRVNFRELVHQLHIPKFSEVCMLQENL